jgi:hypothetical protein
VVYSFDKLNNTTINSRFLHNATFDPVEKRWKAGQFRGLIADKGYFSHAMSLTGTTRRKFFEIAGTRWHGILFLPFLPLQSDSLSSVT